MKIEYISVLKQEQNEALQVDALQHEHSKRILIGKGLSIAYRSGENTL